MERRGIKYALDYLKSFYPLELFKDELYKRAGCSVSHEAVYRKLRLAVERGEIEAIPHETADGKTIKKYRYNPAYISEKKVSADWFFFSVRGNITPSGYYQSVDALMVDVKARGLTPLHIYHGTYDRPLLWEGK